MERHVRDYCGRPCGLPKGWDRLWWQYWKNLSHCFGQQRRLELLSPLVYQTFFIERLFWGLGVPTSTLNILQYIEKFIYGKVTHVFVVMNQQVQGIQR